MLPRLVNDGITEVKLVPLFSFIGEIIELKYGKLLDAIVTVN